MSQAYSNPRRETDPFALPDLEIFLVPEDYPCLDEETGSPLSPGWYWWPCSPGCLPDGDPIGSFESEEDALADAQSDAPYDPDDDLEEG